MFKINKRRQILLKARIYFHTRLGRIRTHKKREEMAMSVWTKDTIEGILHGILLWGILFVIGYVFAIGMND